MFIKKRAMVFMGIIWLALLVTQIAFSVSFNSDLKNIIRTQEQTIEVFSTMCRIHFQ